MDPQRRFISEKYVPEEEEMVYFVGPHLACRWRVRSAAGAWPLVACPTNNSIIEMGMQHYR